MYKSGLIHLGRLYNTHQVATGQNFRESQIPTIIVVMHQLYPGLF
jgi:hypothetical protein